MRCHAIFPPVGVAYVLKLVDQYHAFDSLHWFQSVRMKYDEDMVSTRSLSVQDSHYHQLLLAFNIVCIPLEKST